MFGGTSSTRAGAAEPRLRPTPRGTDGVDLTRIAIGGVNYNIAGGGEGGTPGTPVEVFSATALSGGETITELTLTEDVARGNWYAFITLAVADRVEAVEYISTDDILDATETYSDASPPTETSAGGYTVQIPTPNNVGFRHDTLSVWRSDEANKIWVQHSGRNEALTLRINQIPRGGGSGGGGGDPLTVFDEQTAIRTDVTGIDFRGVGVTCQAGAEDGRAVCTIPGGTGGDNDPFSGITTVTVPPDRQDLLLTRDVSVATNRALTVESFLNDFNEIAPTGAIDTGDYLFFSNISNPDSPMEKISATDFMTAFPRLVTAPLFAAPQLADEFIIFDVSDSNAVKRLSVSNVRETVGRVEVESSNTDVVANARTIDFGADILVTADGDSEADITLSQNVARLDDLTTEEQVEDWVDGLLVAGANIDLAYNDAAGTLTITGQAGGGGGTTVVANPGYVEANDDLGSITIGGSDFNIRHPHRGCYDNAQAFIQGDIVETNCASPALSQFWIAREDIAAGQGEPNEGVHGMWWHVAGNDGNFRGTLDDNTRYDVFPGDYWIQSHEFYIATGAASNVLGSDLTRTGHDEVDQLIHSLQIQDENGPLTEDVQMLNFTGAGVTCTEPTTDMVTCNVPGGGAPANASTTTRGIIELATQAEVNSSTPDSVRAVTPATLQGHTAALRSDAAINYTTPANESTLLLASRQSIAEALSAVVATIPTDSGLTTVAPGDLNATNAGTTGLLPFSTGAQFTWARAGAALRSDATSRNQTPSSADRVFLTDESVAGDPLEYLTVQDLYNGLRDVITVPNSVPASTDRLFTTDESASGDPVEYVTVSQLLDSIREVRTTENATPADDDRIYITDESDGGDPLEYIEFDDLRDAVADGPTLLGSFTRTDTIASSACYDSGISLPSSGNIIVSFRRINPGSFDAASTFIVPASLVSGFTSYADGVGAAQVQRVHTDGLGGQEPFICHSTGGDIGFGYMGAPGATIGVEIMAYGL